MEWTKDDYRISTDKEKINVDYVHNFLRQTYWAENIPLEVVRRSIEGSLCFGVYQDGKQIGFARVITDGATFAYLADVFMDERFRGRGLSKWLMEIIISHPQLQGLRRFLLATRDAHGLYRQFGFQPLNFVDRWMQIHQPDVYREKGSSQ
ncbi:MAG TPA: GNAT family N-acetyltransferase [Flavisolibacter sp.]